MLLEEAGELIGSVLDVGCKTVKNALFLVCKGHTARGIDSSPIAIKKAQSKAERRTLNVTCLLRDALDLHNLGTAFDTIIDSGFFHVLSDAERILFITNFATVLYPGDLFRALLQRFGTRDV